MLFVHLCYRQADSLTKAVTTVPRVQRALQRKCTPVCAMKLSDSSKAAHYRPFTELCLGDCCVTPTCSTYVRAASHNFPISEAGVPHYTFSLQCAAQYNAHASHAAQGVLLILKQNYQPIAKPKHLSSCGSHFATNTCAVLFPIST